MFANVLLVDEINRASPKTQSALLEAMQEAQVTVDGVTLPARAPFFVIATQNPIEYEGTYPLPEAQLDRFTARLALGYPAARRGGAHAGGADDGAPARPPRAGCRPRRSRRRDRGRRAAVYVEESVGAYVVTLLRHTRESSLLALGASPRAGIALLRMAKARAVALGRDYVVPDDVQAIAVRGPRASGHRRAGGAAAGVRGEDAVERALAEAPVPA